MDPIRDYGDGKTVVLHLAPDHPALSELKSRARWWHPYYDTRGKKPVTIAYDFGFTYQNGDRPALVRELATIAKNGAK